VTSSNVKDDYRGGRKLQPVSNTSAKTRAFWDEKDGAEPVVGWLICIEGVSKGQDYRIHSEKNFIGRSEEMHICITGDNAISRRNHAVISYNPIQRNFFLIPGEGVGLVYHNNEAIYAPTELSAYDVIQMGKSKFIFIPLCGIHFEWETEEISESL
jgi:pSer/pThr/pTyr-binding forkhead associated (FHA) protein